MGVGWPLIQCSSSTSWQSAPTRHARERNSDKTLRVPSSHGGLYLCHLQARQPSPDKGQIFYTGSSHFETNIGRYAKRTVIIPWSPAAFLTNARTSLILGRHSLAFISAIASSNAHLVIAREQSDLYTPIRMAQRYVSHSKKKHNWFVLKLIIIVNRDLSYSVLNP